MKQSDLLQMMSNETWLTAQDAISTTISSSPSATSSSKIADTFLGLADEIMFVNEEDDEPVMNSMEDIPSKSAINKLMNLILKADKQQNKTTSQFENPSLKDKKLAILMERRK